MHLSGIVGRLEILRQVDMDDVDFIFVPIGEFFTLSFIFLLSVHIWHARCAALAACAQLLRTLQTRPAAGQPAACCNLRQCPAPAAPNRVTRRPSAACTARLLPLVCVPAGGGGMIAGIAAVVKALKPRIQVIGVEPTGECRKANRYKISVWKKGENEIARMREMSMARQCCPEPVLPGAHGLQLCANPAERVCGMPRFWGNARTLCGVCLARLCAAGLDLMWQCRGQRHGAVPGARRAGHPQQGGCLCRCVRVAKTGGG